MIGLEWPKFQSTVSPGLVEYQAFVYGQFVPSLLVAT